MLIKILTTYVDKRGMYVREKPGRGRKTLMIKTIACVNELTAFELKGTLDCFGFVFDFLQGNNMRRTKVQEEEHSS
jgi:hypothetical protein